MNPFVSIIIPCYNQGQYLTEALDSVYNQTFFNWECLIIDDGSIDNTSEIAKLFTEKDPRFIYFYKENGGVSSARNFGIAKASGSYLQFLDSDDLLEDRKIQYSIDEINKSEEEKPQIIISNFKMISWDSKEILPAFCELSQESFTFENFLFNLFSIQLQCGFFDKNLFKNIKFPENLSAQEDWVVWINLFKDNPKYVFIDLPLAFYRMNPSGRMNTIGADDNQIKILDSLKEIVTYEQYHKFSLDLLTRYFYSTKLFRQNLTSVKKSNTYQGGLIIKRALNKLGLLKIGIFFLKIIMTFKAK